MKKIVIIAEKPSLARVIADGLTGERQEHKTHIDVGRYTIVKLSGHVLANYEPDDYDEKYKKWNMNDLPIIPDTFQLKPTKKEIVKFTEKALKNVSEVWHAGDPDREGQLLVDELLDYCDYQGEVKRLLIADTSPEGVSKALDNIKDNQDFYTLYQSGKARSQSDWIIGMNMSRLVTLLAQAAGYEGVLSVGRVQTALLGIIVRRHVEIKDFTPVPFYEVVLTLHNEKIPFRLVLTQEQKEIFQVDDAGRILDKEYAKSVLGSMRGSSVKDIKIVSKSEKQPLAYSLSTLQREASKRFNMSAAKVLKTAQSLYEKKVLSYPRSDCQYLPDTQFTDAPKVIDTILSHCPIGERNMFDTSIKSKCWNDKKVTAHYGIIPTAYKGDVGQLSGDEKALYELVSKRYLMQFLPEYRYEQTVMTVGNDDYSFMAKGQKVIEKGWKVLATQETTDTFFSCSYQKGQKVEEQMSIEQKKTTPPKPFDESSLLGVMENASRFLQFKSKKGQKCTLGTPATQSSMIETLFKRNYVEKKGKMLLPTKSGIELIETLPDILTYPDLTVKFEQRFEEIESGNLTLDEMQHKVRELLGDLTAHIERNGIKIKSNFKSKKSTQWKSKQSKQ